MQLEYAPSFYFYVLIVHLYTFNQFLITSCMSLLISNLIEKNAITRDVTFQAASKVMPPSKGILFCRLSKTSD